MNRQSQPELFSQRPVRSDFARSRGGGLNLRKLFVVLLLLAAAIAAGMVINGMQSTPQEPEEIPTIQAEMPIKQRPDQPGGIDIPHQDVTVFQQLDNASAKPSKPGLEHLLPEPATPQEVVPAAPVAAASPVAEVTPALTPEKAEELPPAITAAEPVKEEPAKIEEPAPVEVQPATQAAALKKEAAKVEKKVSEKEKVLADKVAAVTTTAKKVEPMVKAEAKKEEAAVPARLPKELFTADNFVPPAAQPATADQSKTEQQGKETPAETNGKKVQVQLASYPEEPLAQKELLRFQNKYAGILGSTTLRVVRADLGAKGTYYRIMGSSTESKAKAICSDIQKQKGNCIVVK